MTSREQFEAWATYEGYTTTRYTYTPDVYEFGETRRMWTAWQASRDALGIDGMSGLKTKQGD
ncbi:MAG: hypothetical protein RSC43_00660 [Clostridia bacterium]